MLLALAFPPLPFGLLALVAITPLLAVMDEDPAPGFRRGFVRGALFGSVFYLLLLFWLWDLARFTPLIVPTWALSSLYLGSLVGLTAGLAQWLRARTGWSAAWLLPPAWIALEKLLLYGDLRFTWGAVADTLTPYPLLLQTAELWGPLGLSLLVLVTNGLVYTLWRRAREGLPRRPAGIALATLGAVVLGYGLLRWAALAEPPEAASGRGSVKVAVIQPNIPQEVRDNVASEDVQKARLLDLSRRALAESPALVVWPETATRWLRYDAPYLRDILQVCCRPGGEGSPGGGVPFLVGGLDAENPRDPRERFFNAAFMISELGEITSVYRKVLLVPMTEKVPFQGFIDFLKPDQWSGSFSAGEGFHTLAFHASESTSGPPHHGEAVGEAEPGRGGTGRVQVGVPICYEIMFPQAIRAFRLAGARLIVTITNDAWFGRTPAPFQHFSQLKLRAVENRIAIARSANTGISGFVTARGEVLRKTDIFEPAYLVERLPLAGPLTPYTRWGDWILPATWLAVSIAVGAGRSRRKAPGSRSAAG